MGLRVVWVVMTCLALQVACRAEEPQAAEPSPLFLLTDNLTPGKGMSKAFRGMERIETGAQIRFVMTDETRPCDAKLAESAAKTEGERNALLDGFLGTEGWCQAWGSWSGKEYYANFVIDLQQPYAVGRVTLWSQQQEKQGITSCDLLCSNDGTTFFPIATLDTGEIRNTEKNWPAACTFELAAPVTARYIKLVAEKRTGSQIALAEVAVWGQPSAERSILPENACLPVAFSVTGIDSSGALLDWEEFAVRSAGVKAWRIYESEHPFTDSREEGVRCVETVAAQKASRPPVRPNLALRKALYPRTPGTTYYWGMTAEYESGEYPFVKATAYTVPEPFACATLGDMIAINHFWRGGGARSQSRPNQDAWEDIAVQLLAQTPVRQVRWWLYSPNIVNKFYQYGIGLHTFARADEPWVRGADQLGIRCFGGHNEPELSGQPLEKILAEQDKKYLKIKELLPNAVVTGPVCNISDSALEWMEAYFAAGGGKTIDIIDLHTYAKAAGGFTVPDGYPRGAPESLFERMEKVRAILERHGQADKPLISTEFGYTDCSVGNPSGRITPADKAAFTVRGLILHYVLGYRRVFLYSFFDEGPDKNYTEHQFGLVDYDLQKKPAFYALCALGKALGACTLEGPVQGAALPDMGYVFRDTQSGQRVSVLWNGASPRLLKLAVGSGRVRIVSMMGEERTLGTDERGEFLLRVDAAPVYVIAENPVTVLSSSPVLSAQIGETENGGVAFALSRPSFSVRSEDSEAALTATLKNTSAADITVTCSVWDETAAAAGEPMRVPLRGGEEKNVSLRFPVPSASEQILWRYRVTADYATASGSFSETAVAYLRRLAPASAKNTAFRARMSGYDSDVWVLSGERLELTLDPARGGRVLELLDRRTGYNLVNMDYGKLPDLASVSYAYAIWDQLKDTETGKRLVDRNVAYEARPCENGIELAHTTEQLVFTKTYAMADDGSLRCELGVANRSDKPIPVSYYLHPEYRVGLFSETERDALSFPVGGKVLRMPFWNGLGERKLEALDQGWWTATDLEDKVTLRQDFPLDTFAVHQLWYGAEAFNVELTSREGVAVPPGGRWSAWLRWTLAESAP